MNGGNFYFENAKILSEKEASEIKAGYQLAWMQLQNASLIASKYNLDPFTRDGIDKALVSLKMSYDRFIEAVSLFDYDEKDEQDALEKEDQQ